MGPAPRGGRPFPRLALAALLATVGPVRAAPPPLHAYRVETVAFEPLEDPHHLMVEAVVVNTGSGEGPAVPLAWSVPALEAVSGALRPDPESGTIGPIAPGGAEQAVARLEVDLSALAPEARAALGALPVTVRIEAGDADPGDDVQSVEIPLGAPEEPADGAGVTIAPIEIEVAPLGHEGQLVVSALVSAEVPDAHELHYTVRQEGPAEREVGRGVEPVRPDEPMTSLTVPIAIRPGECGEEWSGRLEVRVVGPDGAELGRGSRDFATLIPPGACAGTPAAPEPVKAP